MTPIAALKELPGLVERKLHHLGELATVEAELRQAVAALGPQGWHYEQLVAALTRPEPQAAAPEPPAVEPAAAAGPAAPWEEPAEVAPELVQPEAPGIPAVVEPVDEPAPPAAEIVQPVDPAPARAAAEPTGDDPTTGDDDGWVSCKAYAAQCGVSEPVIYNAITRGLLHGHAVQAGPPKRVRPEVADRQILERSAAGILRMNVAKRLERTVVIEAAGDPAAMTVRVLRGFGYQVLELQDELFDVNGARLGPGRVVEKATSLKAREARLAAARRNAA